MYYDMSGFDYGILDVVQVLHLRKRRGNYYDCPFCGETHGKLNINVEKNVFRCNRCDASGGMLKLYADLHNVTLSEANQQIREALGKGEYRTDYIKATPVQEEKATAELAPIEEIHRTYQRMLSMLTLNRKHQEDLQRRGLKPEQIEAQRYRSVPLFGMKKLVKRLAEEGYMVKGVPGFYRDTDGNWTINFKAENSGILIPIVSLDGFIQGFQIRVDHVTDTKKYIWLSSVNYDQGVSSGSPVHVIGDLAAERVYLTEGALKGTIAHYLSGATFVCVAGVNQYRNLKPVLERMKGYQKKKMRQLSGGMKRRVGLVQALLHEPDFLIVDEPTTGLDPEERIRIRNLLVDFAEERTVLFSTHVVEDLMATCNQLAVMKKGRFLYTGTMRELLNKARGHVWECCTEDESLARELERKYHISSKQYTEEGIRLRLLGENMPSESGCIACDVTLEDAYIYVTNR